MSWRFEFLAELGCIQIFYSGTFKMQDFVFSTAETQLLARGNPHLFLVDLMDRECEVSGAGVYLVPRRRVITGSVRESKLALAVPERGDMWRDMRFFEDVCCNRCWQVKAFPGRQHTIDWLAADASSN